MTYSNKEEYKTEEIRCHGVREIKQIRRRRVYPKSGACYLCTSKTETDKLLSCLLNNFQLDTMKYAPIHALILRFEVLKTFIYKHTFILILRSLP